VNLCDLTFLSPAENLAADEVLLDYCESTQSDEILRFWEPSTYFVVAGYANRLASEVNLDFCHRKHIPVFRRCTGGGTVLQGSGVLNYSLILKLTKETDGIAGTNEFVLKRHAEALGRLLRQPVQREGQTDLAINGLKFSGNAQRRHRRSLLFHGSFLIGLDLSLMEKTLLLPTRQPSYRANREHSKFLMNLGLPLAALKMELCRVWNATDLLSNLPRQEIASLAQKKYSSDEWNLKF